MKNRDKFPAFRDLGKQILNQELQETMSNVFKHIDDRQGWHVTRVELGRNPTNYLVQTQVFLRRKENPQKGNLV